MALARFVCRRAVWIVALAAVLSVVSVIYSAARIEFVTDRNALVDPEAEYNRRFLQFKQEFGDQELMLLMIGPAPGPVGNPGYAPPVPGDLTRQQMKAAAVDVLTQLRKRPDLFPGIYDRVDPDSFGGTRMLYMPTQDLRQIRDQVAPATPLLAQLGEEPSFPGLLKGMRRALDESPPDASNADAAAEGGREMARLIGNLRASLAAGSDHPGMEAMFSYRSSDPTLDPDGWFFLWQGRLLFAALMPAKDQGALDQVAEPLAFIREVIAEVQPKYPELAIGLSGRPVIYSDEMASSGRDMTWATVFAVVAVGLMFVLAFRSVARPLLAVLCLMLALAWTFGLTTLVIGHLNIFAMVFAVVLVGLGIDFGIHLLAHYLSGLARGLSVREALVEVYAEIGMGTVLGALTTALALSTAALTDFLGLAELGLICGMGILCCLAAMMLVFPALLVLLDARRVGDGNENLRALARDHALKAEPPAKGKTGLFSALAVMLLLLVSGIVAGIELARGYVPFEYDLLKLNDPDSEAVHWEKLLIDNDQRASYVACIRNDPAELRELEAQIQPLIEQGLVRSTESIFPPDEAARRDLLREIGLAMPLSIADPGEPSDATALRAAARRLQSGLRDLSLRGESLREAFAAALDELDALMRLCEQQGNHVNMRLGQTERPFFAELTRRLRELKRDSAPPAITPDTLPDVLRSRYVGTAADGTTRYALYVYPAKNVWQNELAAEFNAAITAIDPAATGVTIQIHESGKLIVAGFGTSVLYAFIAIVVLLVLDLRRPLAVLVALLPLLGSLVVLLGVMTLTSLSFNFANFFAVPILIGTTIDAGVYLVHAQRHGDTVRTLRQTRRACLLCGMTTLLGFGALVTASHKGIVSLGFVLVVGCVAGILVSYALVPYVLGWFNQRGKRL